MNSTSRLRSMKGVAALALTLAMSGRADAIKIDISLSDIERALTIARSREAERAQFHAPYIKAVDSPDVERAEIVSEFRRVVLTAEEHIARGDRTFAYSTTRAHDALQVFRRRVSVIARIRFHPLNNYVTLPPVTISMVGNERALIGVRRDPVFGFTKEPGESAPLLGAIVEASFDANALGQVEREFVVSLNRKELARFTLDLGAVD